MALDIILVEDVKSMPPADSLAVILFDELWDRAQEGGSPARSQSCLIDPADVLFGMRVASIICGDRAVENYQLCSVLRYGASCRGYHWLEMLEEPICVIL